MTEPAPVSVSEHRLQGEGSLTLFGFPATKASVRLVARSGSWRLGRAAQAVAVSLVVAPLAALVPPHAPWVLGVLVGGGIAAHRRWSERFTLEAAEGPCPRCGNVLRLRSGRLRLPHPAPCDGCHHESRLEVPAALVGHVA